MFGEGRVSQLLLTVDVQFVSEGRASRGQPGSQPGSQPRSHGPSGGHHTSSLRGQTLCPLTWSWSSVGQFTATVSARTFHELSAIPLNTVLPKWRAEDRVGGLDLLPLGSHSAEVALMQRSVETSLQGCVNVGQSHQVLGFLKVAETKTAFTSAALSDGSSAISFTADIIFLPVLNDQNNNTWYTSKFL